MKLHLILAIILILTNYSYASDDRVKRYTVESGEIHYKINGSGEVMGIKMQINGEKTLLFKDFGSTQIEEDSSQRITTGLNNETVNEHNLSKTDDTTVYKVDFINNKIIATTDPLAIKYSGQNMGEQATNILVGFGGNKIGTDKVMGYDCNIWQLIGGKQCLYQDQIPLWIEVNIMGLVTKYEAISITFNQNIADSKFKLPNYPIENSPMLMSQTDIERAAKMEEAINRTVENMKQSGQNPEKMDEKDMAAAMMMLMSQDEEFQKEFKKMQDDLPKILALVNEYRNCMQSADEKPQAIKCQEISAEKARDLGLEDDDLDESLEDDLGSWSDIEKQQYLRSLDEDIDYMEQALPCIQKAKNPMEIISCPGFGEVQ